MPPRKTLSRRRAPADAAIVVATGNDGNTSTIAVTVHTFEGYRASYANVGTGTTLSAPGDDNESVVTSLGSTGSVVDKQRQNHGHYGCLYQGKPVHH